MTIILTHDHAGFEALAALAAAAKLYPESRVLLPKGLLPGAALFWERSGAQLSLKTVGEGGAPPSPDLVVVVNTRQKSRLGNHLPLLEQARAIHIFDRHPSASDDIEGEELFVGEVGATATLLVEQIRRRSLSLNEAEALLCLLGIYHSTASLGSAGTTPRDAAAAAFLWEQGIDARLLEKYLRAPLGESRKGLLEKLYHNSKLYDIAGRRVVVTIISAEEHLQGALALLRRLQEIEEFDLTVTLVEQSAAVTLTARSIADELDLGLLLAPLGAAGGRREVAARLEGEESGDVAERLLELLERHLPPPVDVLQIASVPVAAVDEGTTVAAADEYLEERGHRAGPVLKEGQVAGMISRRELNGALRSGLGEAPVRGLMKPAVTAGAEISATALRRLFVEKGAERVVLVNGENEPVGLVSPIDLLHFSYRLDRRSPAALPKGSFLNSPPPAEIENAAGLIKEALPVRWQSLLMLIGQRASLLESAVYLVGGTVRDLLLGREPSRDLDFVVIPDAVSLAEEMKKYLGGKLKIFERFGTASLFLKNGLRLDFATARLELYEAPAALPQVRESNSLKRDLYRRDFSINTLACSLLPESYGELFDFFGGRQDLHDGVIRTLYHLSFVDDPLRMLRAVRFEQRFGFRIEEKTAELIGKALQSRLLEKISRSRLAQEVSLIYAEKDPPAVLMRLHELGALGFIYPRLYPDEALWQRLNRISENLAGARQREWSRRPEEELVYLGGLLMEMAPHDRQAIIRRLGLSRRRTAAVLQGSEAVPPLLRELEEAGRGIRPAVLVNRLDPLSPEALLLLDALAASSAVKDNIRLYLESLQHVRPRLRGGALRQLGLKPGPIYGEIMEALRRAVLDGKVRGEGEELDFITAYLRKEG